MRRGEEEFQSPIFQRQGNSKWQNFGLNALPDLRILTRVHLAPWNLRFGAMPPENTAGVS
jgi:hypothetical protein